MLKKNQIVVLSEPFFLKHVSRDESIVLNSVQPVGKMNAKGNGLPICSTHPSYFLLF